MVERAGFGVPQTWIRILPLPLTGFQLVQVTRPPVLGFLHLQNGDVNNSNSYNRGLI